MKLFKHSLYCPTGTEIADYFVFKNKKIVLEANKDNVANINKFYSGKY